ncbi:GNAT family N-acetyltransferase [Methylobacterium nigriterrae]|uniref:GNAT family N-acetyltransferase n=1 Tax=Methylobacterium nigriterrae TaxID=3127512 RepID=UPI003013C628
MALSTHHEPEPAEPAPEAIRTADEPREARAGAARPPQVRCRRIAGDDRAALVDLLARGFPAHDHVRWSAAFARIEAHARAQGREPLGFVLVADGALVGVVLTIFGPGPDGSVRCNLSSWYVDPDYRGYAPLLVAAAIRDRSVTYINVSSEAHTRPIIEAQGFSRYANGTLIAVPLASRPRRGIRVVTGAVPDGIVAEASEREIVRSHAALGCLTAWVIADGRAHPLVFLRRRVLRGRVAVASLIYCRETADLGRYGHAIGRFLARNGLFFLMLDADAPVPGLAGRVLPGRMPKYARGPHRPRLGDLSFTEAPLLGF